MREEEEETEEEEYESLFRVKREFSGRFPLVSKRIAKGVSGVRGAETVSSSESTRR